DLLLTPISLQDLVTGTQKQVFNRVIKQVRHRINLKKGDKIDTKVRSAARRLASFGLRYLEGLKSPSKEIPPGKRYYVFDHRLLFKETQTGRYLVQDSGIAEALRLLLNAQPYATIKFPSPLNKKDTEKLLMDLGIDEVLLKSGQLEIVDNWFATGNLRAVYEAMGYAGEEGMERAQTEVVTILSEQGRDILQDIELFKGKMKIAVGNIGKGKGETLFPDVIALGVLLGKVDKAFQDGKIHPVLEETLRGFFIDVLHEYQKDRTDDERLQWVDQLIAEIQSNGFFRMPSPTDSLNDMMRNLAIEESYFDVAA
ncbi:MAG: hypothetical protein Q8Q33_10840, partial [Chlamydiota bacterium]|nr:hypothetical protein [Chlamydiota bacterium]